MNKNTKRLLTVALTAAMAVAGLAAHAGETLTRVTKSGKMVVATSGKWPPQAFLNDKQEFDGFDIDVAKELGRRLGLKVAFETPDFSLMTGGHWRGRWDISVLSVTPTKARAKLLDFPALYYFSPYVFAVHSSSKAVTRNDLNGKVIGVEGGTTSEDYIGNHLEIDAPGVPAFKYMTQKPKEVKTYVDSMLPFDDLRLGDGVRLDAIITPEQTALSAIKNGYPVKILANDYAFQEPLAIVTDKGDAEWNQKIGDTMKAMKQDGTMTKISMKWFER
ncbi:MAG: amino acid transporter substrate-binding protein, partial [Rhodoferax sp.]|nr:amino acid transporter substrate-binding protein [Rhodoferax sp.]